MSTDPRTLMAVARPLLARGDAPAAILKAIYGIDMPREMLALHEVFLAPPEPEHDLGLDWEYVPWELMKQSEAKGPTSRELARELAVHERWPNLVLLGLLRYDGTPHGNSFLAYDLDELRAGRTTVFATPRSELTDPNVSFTAIGPSLLAVLRETLTTYTALLSPSVDADELAFTNELIEVIAGLAIE